MADWIADANKDGYPWDITPDVVLPLAGIVGER